MAKEPVTVGHARVETTLTSAEAMKALMSRNGKVYEFVTEAECRERERKAKLEAWSECYRWMIFHGWRLLHEMDAMFPTREASNTEALRRYGEVVK